MAPTRRGGEQRRCRLAGRLVRAPLNCKWWQAARWAMKFPTAACSISTHAQSVTLCSRECTCTCTHAVCTHGSRRVEEKRTARACEGAQCHPRGRELHGCRSAVCQERGGPHMHTCNDVTKAACLLKGPWEELEPGNFQSRTST